MYYWHWYHLVILTSRQKCTAAKNTGTVSYFVAKMIRHSKGFRLNFAVQIWTNCHNDSLLKGNVIPIYIVLLY